jgi:hypothetical protein
LADKGENQQICSHFCSHSADFGGYFPTFYL